VIAAFLQRELSKRLSEAIHPENVSAPQMESSSSHAEFELC
jgi:hypothetical protein